MAYEKQGFYSGEKLKASQLDAMEDGIIEAQSMAANTQTKINIEDGVATGSVQQKGYPTEAGNVLGAIASGEGAVAFGGQRYDKIGKDVTEEPQTEAKGIQSFAVGGGALAAGTWSVAIGKDTKAYQRASFAAGGGSKAGLTYEEWLIKNSLEDTDANKTQYETTYGYGIALGEKAIATGRASVAINNNTEATGDYAFAAGNLTKAQGAHAVAIGHLTKATGNQSFAAGDYTEAAGIQTVAIGYGTNASGDQSFAAGNYTKTPGAQAVALGYRATASGDQSFAAGQLTEATGEQAVAVGYMTKASGVQSFAEGNNTQALGGYSHALGKYTIARGVNSIAAGNHSETFTDSSFAFGEYAVAGDTTVKMSNCIALGNHTKAVGYGSAAMGLGAYATGSGQVAVGRFNNPVSGTYFIVGNGTADDNRSNAFEVYSNGDIGIKYGSNTYSLHKMLKAYFTDANLK